jgi:PHP domain
MQELVISLHMHTTYSDGTGSHKDIGAAALKAGLDAVIVTDHNVLVSGKEGYYKEDRRKMLMLVGEEIHDQARQPQKSHLLVFNAQRELANFAPDPQILINQVHAAGGLSFIAHLYDPPNPAIKEVDISWVDWQVYGFTGLELWNSLSELKIQGKTILHILFYVFFPAFLNHQPPEQHLAKWDELLKSGKKIIAIGGADAHALHVSAGPIHRTIYPYEFHFRGITTHLQTTSGLTGDLEVDKKMIYEAIGAGHCFVAYDLPGSTRGFNFSAQGRDGAALMGDEIPAAGGVTFNIKLPEIAECRFIKDGKLIQTWNSRETCTHISTEPGVYRVEVYRRYLGLRRGWIFSNPIYVR